MHSRRLTFFGVAALVLAGSASHAADYPQPVYQPEPQPIIIQQPAPAAFDCCDGWYLRGQIGVGMNNGEYDLITSPLPAGARYFNQSVSDTFFVGVGIGYNWNSWLRFEGTVGLSRPHALFGERQNIRPWRRSLYRRTRWLPEVVGVPRQRFCRSRHLELLHAVRRHRRRHGVAPGGGLQGHHTAGSPRAAAPSAWAATPPSGASPGRSTPASPTTSPRASRSISPTATWISARRRRSSIARGPCGQVVYARLQEFLLARLHDRLPLGVLRPPDASAADGLHATAAAA